LREWTTQETAEELDLTPVNVRVRLHRARKKLREVLLQRTDWAEA
jgi:RNA polymerase sigma-70 factor (ECF subfamily)